MIVKCLYEEISNLPQDLKRSMMNIPIDFAYGKPKVGENYKVYAINFQYEASFYCIQIKGISYPEWVPSQFFEVIDSSLSKYWIFHPLFDLELNSSNIVSFKDWVLNPYFYGELIEEYEQNVTTFRKYKKLIDEE